MSTMQDKGDVYVQEWPGKVARTLGASAVYVIHAINEVTGTTLPDDAAYSRAALPEVAALTPETARAVIAAARTALTRVQERERTHCTGCGLPLRDGACAECV